VLPGPCSARDRGTGRQGALLGGGGLGSRFDGIGEIAKALVRQHGVGGESQIGPKNRVHAIYKNSCFHVAEHVPLDLDILSGKPKAGRGIELSAASM